MAYSTSGSILCTISGRGQRARDRTNGGLGTAILVALGCLVACTPAEDPQASPAPPPAKAAAFREPGHPADVGTYPKGRWRLGMHEDLHRVVLWVSHIVIRHAASELDEVQRFRSLPWQPDGKPPSRSKQAAKALAVRIADTLRDDPDAFVELAKRYSEDRPTRTRGGSLGGVRATQLGPAFLDALQTLRFGETTEVIETKYGYHVLKLRSPPPSKRVSGEHIVIRYHGCINEEGLGNAGRTREQAFALAERLRTEPERFHEHVERYSEHPDRVRRGDMGEWSTRAPDTNGREIEVLSGLEIGEISAPLDTRYGVQLIRRVANRPRTVFAVEKLQVRYSPLVASEHPHSRAQALQRASRWAELVERDVSAFDPLRNSHCCEKSSQWLEGAGHPLLEAALRDLPIGRVAKQPIDVGWFLVIPRRVQPGPSESAALQYELPQPSAPDVDGIVEVADGKALAANVARMRMAISGRLSLSEGKAAALDAALTELETAFTRAHTAEERVEAKDRFVADLRGRIGASEAIRFQAAMRRWVSEQLMH